MARQSHAPLTLVLGGARSGKSRHGEKLLAAEPGPLMYLATAEAWDEEMRLRIETHRARRDQRWTTIEAPHDLPGALSLAGTRPALVDCLTLWLTNLMLDARDPEAETARLETALAAREAPTVLVANEVGLGIVPESRLGRAFRDAAGLLHQRLAARADRVLFMIAGLPMVVK
jgi:adenosyl cobinamide kinase/adenosyl cobinamide phosphate guanylyltransferase